MTRRLLAAGAVLAGLALASRGGDGGNFDRLNDTDRKALQERFEREVWPLLQRSGKDGCVGCHDAKSRNLPKFSGDVGRDFRMLVKEGFFLHEDPGNLVARVAAKDKKSRMPPGNRPAWTPEEVKLLRDFTAEVEKRQKK